MLDTLIFEHRPFSLRYGTAVKPAVFMFRSAAGGSETASPGLPHCSAHDDEQDTEHEAVNCRCFCQRAAEQQLCRDLAAGLRLPGRGVTRLCLLQGRCRRPAPIPVMAQIPTPIAVTIPMIFASIYEFPVFTVPKFSGTSAGLYAPSRCNDQGQGSTASLIYREVRKTKTYA
jgi:hypothetical protein